MRSAKQEKTRNSYHNTLMLLQQYRTIVWMMECFPETIAEELERPFEGVDTLIQQMDVEMALGNRKLENRMEGIQKSRLLLDRVNEALTVLKKKPENGEKLYQLIYLTYISPEYLNHTGFYIVWTCLPGTITAFVSRQLPFFPFVCGQPLQRMLISGWRC